MSSMLRAGILGLQVSLILLLSACAFDTQRTPQPPGQLRLPGAIGLSADGAHLFVVGTNFDLSYGTGALQSFDLSRLDAAIEEASAWPVTIDPSEALTGEVQISSFGGFLSVGETHSGLHRVFVPLRGRGSVAVIDVDAAGALSCVLPEGSDAAEIGTACDRVEVLLKTPGGESVDDPFATRVVDNTLWVGSLSLQPVDPRDPEGTRVSYLTRISVDTPNTPEVIDADGMLPRELRQGPGGRVWAVGQRIAGNASLAELRSYDPASFALGAGSTETYAIAAAVGGGEARGLRISEDGDRLYVITRTPDRLLVFSWKGSFGDEGLVLRGAVALPVTPAHLERLLAPQGDLIVITGNNPDGLVVVDPKRLEVVGLLDGTHCDAAGVCPRGTRTLADREPSADPGERPFGVVAVPSGSGVRIWTSAFALARSTQGGILGIDLRDLDRPWDLRVVAELRSPDEALDGVSR